MLVLTEKRRILENAGFVYNFDRDLYYNRNKKKVFSIDFVEDHTNDELQKFINETSDGINWRFYFNIAPSSAVKHELISVLE